MTEARNLRNMTTIAQTPLLGDEDVPLHPPMIVLASKVLCPDINLCSLPIPLQCHCTVVLLMASLQLEQCLSIPSCRII